MASARRGHKSSKSSKSSMSSGSSSKLSGSSESSESYSGSNWHSRRNGHCCTCDKDVFTFGYGYDWVPFEYIENGQLRGFSVDVVKAVCDAMGKKCTHQVYWDYSLCWNSLNQAPALMDEWFMACVGLIETDVRNLVLGFAGTYAPEPEAFLFVDNNGPMAASVIGDIQAATKIGFLDGFRLDPDCLGNALGITLNAAQIVIMSTAADLAAALQANTIQVMFVDEMTTVAYASEIKKLDNTPIPCAAGGVALAMRKEMECRFDWFEEGLQKIRENGVYDALCADAQAVAPIACLPSIVQP